MSRTRIPGPNLRYLYYRYMTKLEKEVNVKLGFGLFGAGAGAAVVGLALLLYAVTLGSFDAYATWAEPAYALALLALPLVLLGTVILLPPDRRLILGSFCGLAVCLAAVVGFVLVYPSDWQRFGGTQTMYVMVPYALGTGVLTLSLAASMREHAPRLIETVTQIHRPEPSSSSGSGAGSSSGGSGAADSGPSSASSSAPSSASGSGASSPGGSGASGSSDAGGSASSDSAATDPEDVVSAVADGAPAETAVVDDAEDLGATEVIDSGTGGPAGTGRGPITLVINGRRYSFGDGDTFGRRDGPWLDDLVAAAGGHEEIPYVSGDHLEFSIEDDGTYVHDVSRNGTKLNGKDVSGEKARITDGDTLLLADRAQIGVEL